MDVKLLPREGELYVFAQSRDRVVKERAMRQTMKKLDRDELLIKIGQAKAEAGRAFHLVDIHLPEAKEPVTSETFTFGINRKKLRHAYRREGRYLLRSNLCKENPQKLWELYIQLVQIEEAFKNLKGDLSIRPVFHQLEHRIEAHIFISFLAYCLHVTLRRRPQDLAPGLTPRAVLEKFTAMQMIDVHLPTEDDRTVVLSRYTQLEKELQMLIRPSTLSYPNNLHPESRPMANCFNNPM